MNINYVLYGVVVYDNDDKKCIDNEEVLKVIRDYNLFKVHNNLYINFDNVLEIDYDNSRILFKNNKILENFNKNIWSWT